MFDRMVFNRMRSGAEPGHSRAATWQGEGGCMHKVFIEQLPVGTPVVHTRVPKQLDIPVVLTPLENSGVDNQGLLGLQLQSRTTPGVFSC